MSHIAIATPEPGTVKTGYMRSVIETLLDLSKDNTPWTWITEPGNHVWMQRNFLADRLLSSNASHIFFVDSDMTFDGSLCRRLLSHTKPMIGAAYCLKELPPRWNVKFRPGPFSVRDGIAQCESIGFGAVLIERLVIERMTKDASQTSTANNEKVPNLFGDDSLGEDFAFCRRWRDLGGEIWALLDAKIGHIGDYAYGADQSYLDYLNAHVGRADVAPAS